MDVDPERDHLPGLLQLLQPRVIQLRAGQIRREQVQQLLFFQHPNDVGAIGFVGDMAQLFQQIRGRDARFQLRFPRIVVLHLGALFDGETQPHLEAQHPQQADRIVIERIIADRAQLLALQIAHAVVGIEQQAARSRIQRQRDGVDGEIAPAQVLMNGGGPHRGLGPGLGVFLLARHPDGGMDAARKHQMRELAVVVLRQNLRAGLLGNRLRHLDRIALDGEIDIEHRKAAQHVAHRPAGKKHVEIGVRRGRLNLGNSPALVGAQVALEHKHVIAHRLVSPVNIAHNASAVRSAHRILAFTLGSSSRPLRSSSGMMLVHGPPQPRTHYMRINLGRRDVGMPQHALQASQVRSAFQQVRGERMTQHVRRQIVENSRLLAISRQQLPKSLARHGAAAIGHEQIRAGAPLQQKRPAIPQVLFHRLERGLAYRHDAAACCPCPPPGPRPCSSRVPTLEPGTARRHAGRWRTETPAWPDRAAPAAWSCRRMPANRRSASY